MPDVPLSEKAELGVKLHLYDLELVLNFTSDSGQTGSVTTLWTRLTPKPSLPLPMLALSSLPWSLPCHPQRLFQRLPLP